MKFLKSFNENWNYKPGQEADFSLAEDIANDLMPRLEEIKKKGNQFTIEDFEKYMKERGASLQMSDAVLSILIEMGFEFDNSEEELEEEIEPGDYVSFKEHGLLFVVSILGDGYLVSEEEEQRYAGDHGDGFVIPLSSEGTIIEKG